MWAITPDINGISRVYPFIVGVITHLQSGMSRFLYIHIYIVIYIYIMPLEPCSIQLPPNSRSSTAFARRCPPGERGTFGSNASVVRPDGSTGNMSDVIEKNGSLHSFTMFYPAKTFLFLAPCCSWHNKRIFNIIFSQQKRGV